jgi:hypothetical protein
MSRHNVRDTGMQEIRGTIFALIAAAGLVFAEAGAQETEQEQDTAGQQDAIPENSAEESSDGEAGAVDEAAVDPDLDDSELDDQTYESDGDVFIPSEEIPADEPIPFPSDI